jgi:FAD/FMN-containing dehydrogenase
MHGAHGRLARTEHAPALIEAQRSIERALDPHNLLNRYKVLPTPGHRAC